MVEDEEIQAVWEKGKIVDGQDSKKYRKDECGAWIAREQHGNRKIALGLGWEIHHIDPNGSDTLSNKSPLQWENNLHKSDNKTSCKVTSDGNKNVYC